jgi:RimJ/RimL family protein N-acetyltransferase
MAIGSSTAIVPFAGLGGVVIRELARSDRAAVEFAFGRLGARSREQRFLGFKPALTVRDLEQMTNVDHWHHDALIALSPPPRAPIGIAHYFRLEEFDVAEVAVEVVDSWQRRGVGQAIVSALSERARGAGIRSFVATMLRDNRGANALTRQFGPYTVTGSDGTVIEVEIALR